MLPREVVGPRSSQGDRLPSPAGLACHEGPLHLSPCDLQAWGWGAGCFGVSENWMRAEGPFLTNDSNTPLFLSHFPGVPSPAGHLRQHHVHPAPQLGLAHPGTPSPETLVKPELGQQGLDGRKTAQPALPQEAGPAYPWGLHQVLRVGQADLQPASRANSRSRAGSDSM